MSVSSSIPRLLAAAVLASLVAASETRAQCTEGPSLTPLATSCRVGETCTIALALDTDGAAIASTAATVTAGTSGLECLACAPGTAAPEASCSLNTSSCRFNVADLSPPITSFDDGTVATLDVTCTNVGTHVLALSSASFGDTAGLPAGGCTNTAVFECLSPMTCIAAAHDGAVFAGAMTTGTDFTDGADLDPQRDNLTTPLVFANSTSNSRNGGSPDKVTYTVSLPSSGSWFLWGRFYYPGAPGSNDANSFFAKIDAGTLKKFGNGLPFFRSWHWDGEGDDENNGPAPIPLGNLSTGSHTLVVEKREVIPTPPRLDALCFTKDTTPPTDEAACGAIASCSGMPTTTTTTSTTTSTSTSTTSSTTSSTTTSSTTTTTPATTTTTLPSGTLVCFDAANPAGTFAGAMTSSSQFSGGDDIDPVNDSLAPALVYADSTTNAFKGGSPDKATYPINLPSPGTWFLWGRFYYPGEPGSNDANSFLAKIDDSSLEKFGNHLGRFRTFHWDGEGDSETGPIAPLELGNLSAGAHTLVIEKREVVPIPPRLDALCVSKSDAPPSDAEACAQIAGCSGGSTTTSTSTTTTTSSTTTTPSTSSTTTSTSSSTTTTTTTLPVVDVVCVKAGGPGVFSGAMTTGTDFTGGDDSDPARNNLTSPLAFADSTQNASSAGSGDSVTYSIALPSPGAWFLWGRFYYPGSPGSNDANSFFARIDAASARKLGNNLNQFRRWHWDGEGNAETDAPAGLSLGTLAAGAHQLHIYKREVLPTPPRIDVLCLTKNATTPPTDATACQAVEGCP